MQFFESLMTDDRPAGLVDVDADLFLRLVSSFQKDGDRAKIDLASLEALYTDTADRSRRGRSRIVVVDGCRIFIDGQRVEGLTKQQVSMLVYLADTGTATLEALACDIWKNPAVDKRTIRACCERISKKLSADRFPCYLKYGRGTVALKFLP